MTTLFTILGLYAFASYAWLFDMFFRRYPGEQNINWLGRFFWWLTSPVWVMILIVAFILQWLAESDLD